MYRCVDNYPLDQFNSYARGNLYPFHHLTLHMKHIFPYLLYAYAPHNFPVIICTQVYYFRIAQSISKQIAHHQLISPHMHFRTWNISELFTQCVPYLALSSHVQSNPLCTKVQLNYPSVRYGHTLVHTYTAESSSIHFNGDRPHSVPVQAIPVST